ncbi:MAG: hypothetical protein EGQ20_14100 [Bacteroides oleiciplenus]|nr:hypothetical protein [Bacteroides oleiciplenus]
MRTNFSRNRNIIIFAIYLLFSCIGDISSQVSVPEPSICLNLDVDNVDYESVEKRRGDFNGTAEGWTDRFGNEDKSVKFLAKGAGIRLSDYNIDVVHSVSFWAYVANPSEIPVGPMPFGPADYKCELYNWTDTNNRILKGLGREKATVGFNRYIPKPDGTITPWYVWAYKPAQFNQSGWYHIFVVHGMYYTRLIMYKPDSTKAYSYIWMGDQGFPTNKYLYVGAYGEQYPANVALDDFKVYNAELTDDQIEVLHVAEYPKDAYVKIQNKNSGKYAVVYRGSLDDNALIVQNSTGSGNDEWVFIFTSSNECKIKNLRSRKLLVVMDASTSSGAAIIQYDEMGTDNEIWILEYSGSKYFRLKNKNSGKYLGVIENAKSDDMPLIQVNAGEVSSYWSFVKSLPNQRTIIDPGLYRIKNKKSGLYLSVLNKSYDPLAPLVQNVRTNLDVDVSSDTWYIKPSVYGRDAYCIMNSVSKYYMASSFTAPEGDDLFLEVSLAYGGSDWQFLSTGVPNEYRIRNPISYYYAVVKDASVMDDAHIIQYRSGAEDNEIWMLERIYYSDSPLSEGTYKIRNENSFKLMVVKGASESEFAEIIQNSTGGENSEWEIIPATFGFVQLRNRKSHKYLVVKDASLEIGEVLIQHSASTPNSYWKISKETYMDSGAKRIAYTLRNQLSELYAVVKGASTADGVPIIQYNTGEKNKQWTFEKQSSNASTRALDSEQTEIATDMDRPEVMVDCKNDIILLDYPFKSSTELVVRIMDLTGRQVYEGRQQVDGGNNVVTISNFNSTLNASQFYVISIRSTDGKVNCSAKAIMSK